jgi:hypothetical protein
MERAIVFHRDLVGLALKNTQEGASVRERHRARRAEPWRVLVRRTRELLLLDSDDGRSLFVQGCVRNQSKFYDRFNAVVLLSAPADVILDRVARRTTNNYGKTPLERAMILDDLAGVEPLLREGCTHELDASRPLADIIADLTAIASRPMTTS